MSVQLSYTKSHETLFKKTLRSAHTLCLCVLNNPRRQHVFPYTELKGLVSVLTRNVSSKVRAAYLEFVFSRSSRGLAGYSPATHRGDTGSISRKLTRAPPPPILLRFSPIVSFHQCLTLIFTYKLSYQKDKQAEIGDLQRAIS
jgi:hypothetical protein